MSVIIRLQNLPWSANALDIRQYFHGLSIPEGGVHIVGGEQGDAFIAFSTDEDARQAFTRNNGKIKEIQITLMLSSRTEMQRVIEQARTQSMAAFMLPSPAQVPPLPAVVPPVVPAPVPEIRRESKEREPEKKKEKKRSRSRSKSRDRDRDKKDKSRDRKDRKHRDRSRSRSRDRRDRRRRDRSRSRPRSRSRDRDGRRRDRDRDSKREDQSSSSSYQAQNARPHRPEVWANPAVIQPDPLSLISATQTPAILGAFPLNLDQAKRSLVEGLGVGVNIRNQPGLNGFQPNNSLSSNFNRRDNPSPRGRDSWPPGNLQGNHQNNSNNFGRDVVGGFNSQNNGGHNRGGPARGGNFGNMRDEPPPPPLMFEARNRNKKNFGNEDSGLSDDHPVNACVQMEPFYGSYGDLRRFFGGLGINYKGIKIINDQFGHKTGICFVQFRDAHQKNEAMKMSGDKLNNIEIKIQHIRDQEFHDAVDRYNPRMDEDGGADAPVNSKTGKFGHRNITKYFNNGPPAEAIKDFVCLKLEDLPTYVKEQDILHIFSQHPLISLHLDSRPRGGSVAYVKFSSKDVAKKALEERSHHVIGAKAVTVRPCKDEEFEQVNKEKNVPLDEKDSVLATDCLSLSKLPGKTNDRDISDFFTDIGVIPTKIHLMSNNIGFTGQAYCEFETKEEASKAAQKNNALMGSSAVSVVPIKREEMEGILGNTLPHPPMLAPPPAVIPPDHLAKPDPAVKPIIPPLRPMMPNRPPMFRGDGGFGRGGPGPRGPRFGPRGHRGPPRFNPHMGEGNFEEPMPGCTVYMNNVPYKAGTNEILDFFDGYRCTNNVSRRYNPNNTPSAEAKVTFHSPDDAFMAVQELNGKKIWERTIHLEQA